MNDKKIDIIGLGYVGLPLAVEFGKSRPVLGFDINPGRIAELRSGKDSTLEVTPADLAAATQLACSDKLEALADCSVFAQYTVFVEDREAVQEKLKQAGVPTAVHYPIPLNKQPAYRHLCCPDCTPTSKIMASKVMSLSMLSCVGGSRYNFRFSIREDRPCAASLQLFHPAPISSPS